MNIRFSARPASALGCSEQPLPSNLSFGAALPMAVQYGRRLLAEGDSDRMAQVVITRGGQWGPLQEEA